MESFKKHLLIYYLINTKTVALMFLHYYTVSKVHGNITVV